MTLTDEHLIHLGAMCTRARTLDQDTVEIPANDLRLLVAELQQRRLEEKMARRTP